MIVIKPTTLTAAEKHAMIQAAADRFRAKHPHTFVNCPSCEGVGYHEQPFAHGSPKDQVACPCCDGSGLVLPEERDAWFEFEEALR